MLQSVQGSTGMNTHERAGGISGRTGLVALLGHPVSHSLSPRIHNAAFIARDLDLAYLAFDVQGGHLGEAVAGLLALGARGANVTVPYKETVIPFTERLDPLAEQVGAVNTLVWEEGRFAGYNTDVYGFLMGLEHAWGRAPAGARCLVLGAGGAARAVVSGLQRSGAEQVWVYNRTGNRAEDLCLATEAWGPTPCRAIGIEELRTAAANADLIVNATSAGLQNPIKELSVFVDRIGKKHMVMELLYGTRPTDFLRAAQQKGAMTANGSEMLVQQATMSFELWTGIPAPVELMRQEVKRV
jgi:shikimate dehydrogenase